MSAEALSTLRLGSNTEANSIGIDLMLLKSICDVVRSARPRDL